MVVIAGRVPRLSFSKGRPLRTGQRRDGIGQILNAANSMPKAEERNPGTSYSYSSDRPRRDGGIAHDDRLRTAKQHQKAELKRLREEVLDIARELKGMQRLDTGPNRRQGL